MTMCWILAGTLIATLVLYMAVGSARVRAQIVSADVLFGEPGCGAYATAQQVVVGDPNHNGAVDVADLLVFWRPSARCERTRGSTPRPISTVMGPLMWSTC
jgi:hypothetical protein